MLFLENLSLIFARISLVNCQGSILSRQSLDIWIFQKGIEDLSRRANGQSKLPSMFCADVVQRQTDTLVCPVSFSVPLSAK